VKVVSKRSLASGRPDLADVARDLGLSERTLPRRITEEGKTFRYLFVEARRELSRRLLAEPTAEIEEVACLLGHQDTSSFHRAFRDWEGVTSNRWGELNAASIPRGDLDHAVHRGEPAPGVHIHHDDELERLAA
jgi:AraC-like DNA-binding protein